LRDFQTFEEADCFGPTLHVSLSLGGLEVKHFLTAGIAVLPFASAAFGQEILLSECKIAGTVWSDTPAVELKILPAEGVVISTPMIEVDGGTAVSEPTTYFISSFEDSWVVGSSVAPNATLGIVIDVRSGEFWRGGAGLFCTDRTCNERISHNWTNEGACR